MKIFVKEPYLRPKINEIKAHPFFNHGKGIAKYLPTSTLTQPLSEFEIDNIIKNALINGTCLDNEKIIHINNKLYNIYRFSNSFNFNDNLRKYLNINKNNIEENEEEKNENIENIINKENQKIEKKQMDENDTSKQQSHSYSDSNSSKEENDSNNYNKNMQSLQIGNEDKTNKNNETGGFIGENSNNTSHKIDENEVENPIIVEKFIDCSDKFGIGYLLSNGDIGIYFNDGTKMILIKNTNCIYYINKNNDDKIKINYKGSISNQLEGKRKILKLLYKNLIKNVKEKQDFDLNPALNENNINGYVIK